MNIVGEFENIEQATQAAETLREMFATIALGEPERWPSHEPTSVELYYAAVYDVEWPERSLVTWVRGDESAVVQFGRYVTTSSYSSRNVTDGQPITQFIVKWGGIPMVEISDSHLMTVDVTCYAPNRDVSDRVAAEVEPYVKLVKADKGHEVEPPWHEFSTPVESYHYDDLYAGQFSREYGRLNFSVMYFRKTGPGLDALLRYLEAHGCTNVHYSFKLRGQYDVFPLG